MNKKNLYTIAGVTIALVAAVGIYWWQRGDALLVQPPSGGGNGTSAEELRAELERVTQYELANGCVEKDARGQDVFCGESKTRVDMAHAAYQTALTKESQPSAETLTKAEEAIRSFMDQPNLTFQYIATRKHPSNFAVYSNVKEIGGGGRFVADTAEGWDRPVNIFQQKEFINDRCEVYEYEVAAKTNQVVEVHIVYPQEIQNELSSSSGLNGAKCAEYGSLEVPTKTKTEIESVATGFLNRNIANYSEIKTQFTSIPSKKNAVNVAAANEWRWEDTNYNLPDGLTGDPWQKPIIRIIVSSGGKLISYLNTTGLFENY